MANDHLLYEHQFILYLTQAHKPWNFDHPELHHVQCI